MCLYVNHIIYLIYNEYNFLYTFLKEVIRHPSDISIIVCTLYNHHMWDNNYKIIVLFEELFLCVYVPVFVMCELLCPAVSPCRGCCAHLWTRRAQLFKKDIYQNYMHKIKHDHLQSCLNSIKPHKSALGKQWIESLIIRSGGRYEKGLQTEWRHPLCK